MVTLPFWMLQRQIKAENVNDMTLRLVAPNLPTYEISVMPLPTGPGWRVAVDRLNADGGRVPVVYTETPFDKVEGAWQAGFELYRQRVIV